MDQQARDVSVDHALREAMVHYRTLFAELLGRDSATGRAAEQNVPRR